jgi:polysaccharide biosynthesis/export protein
MRYFYFCSFAIILFSSCVSKKEIALMQDYQNQNITKQLQNYEPVIQRDDILYIQIQTNDPLVSNSFNLNAFGENIQNNINLRMASEPFTYLVGIDGTIDMPTLGKVKVEGLTKTDCKKLLEDLLLPYIKKPTINIRTINFKVSVLGEVNRPGVVSSVSDRMTILDALAGAGDLTIFGKRTNLLIVREINGIQTSGTINLTNASFVNSPFYYLQNNDVIYVEPRASKRDSTALGSNVGFGFSLLSLLLSAIVIFRR